MSNKGWKKLNRIVNKEDFSIIYTSTKEKVLVSTTDVPKIKNYTWCHNQGYALTKQKNGNKYETIMMHRLIMNAPNDMLVDHINHDTLDNRRGNLRLASQMQNQMNQKMRIDNKSGVKGVSWNKSASKWTVYIRVNTERIYLGCFKNINDAKEARIQGEIKYFKKYRYMEV